MEKNSVANLLEWLKVEPRTLGWGAILAYGRSETNKVLLQEYINRFSSSSYLKPITERLDNNAVPTQREYLYKFQMDAPRLSFIESGLQDSKANVTMKVVGGNHLSYYKAPGSNQWTIGKIADEDVLDGPKLSFDINLLAATGSVTSAGRVELDISKGTNYELTISQREDWRKLAGARFQQIFRPLPDDQKIFVLNELKFTPDQFLKPSKFTIRTHNKKDSGAALLANEDEGEGAVLVFVAMEGDANGTVPVENSDLKYLLPDGYSATLLLGHDFFFRHVFAEGLKKISNSDVVRFDKVMSPDGKRIVGIIGRNGSRYRRIVEKFTYQGTEYSSSYTSAGIHTGAELDYFRMEILGGANLRIRWKEIKQLQPLSWTGENAGSMGTDWDLKYKFSFDVGELQDLNFSYSPEELHVHSADSNYMLSPEHRSAVESAHKGWMLKMFDEAMADFTSPVANINVFTLNSLLFRGENAVKLDEVHYPADLAWFGHVGPTQTKFTIDQLEVVIGHGEILQFTTTPPRSGLTWTVENIHDESSPVGSIVQSSGRYTAPTAGQLQGSFVRARVTARAGTDTSSALVTVMRRSITINPLIQVATAGDTLELEVSAGAVEGGTLNWAIEDPSSGAVVKPNPAVGKDHLYTPGPPQPKTPPTVDNIVVSNARASEKVSVLVLHRTALLPVQIDDKAGLPENKIQLVIMGEDGPIPPDDWAQRWKVLLGSESAQIDPVSGVLTVSPGPDKFVVVTVLAPGGRPGMPDDDGYIILPLPLFSIPETIRMLCADDR